MSEDRRAWREYRNSGGARSHYSGGLGPSPHGVAWQSHRIRIRGLWPDLAAARPVPCPESSENALDPLYLLACKFLWQERSETSAGWELISGMRMNGRTSEIAAHMLAETENVSAQLLRERAPLRERGPQAGGSLARAECESSRAEVRKPTVSMPMNTPYGLEIIENCVTCKLRQDKWFCGLSSEVLKAFNAASHLTTYPGSAVLFVEGQMPRGCLVLCSGRVKLSTTSREGKVLILKVAQPGETLGLSAVISRSPYEVTAETVGPCQVNYIDAESLLRLLEKHGELGLRAAQALSREFQSAYRDLHELVLSRSSAGKLARLLLSWPGHTGGTGSEIRLRSSLTHEEIAQMIGSSRETVTRLLSELKKKELIRLEGSTLVIRNRTALEALAA